MNRTSKEFLAGMINAISPSGYENCAAAVWKKYAKPFADKVETDVHGNSHAVVNKGGKVKVMLSGHYDEIGFLISNIDDKGFLWIAPVGGWDPQIAQGQRVHIIGNGGKTISGVVGKIAIHLQEPEQRKKVSEIKDLWVDIGVKNKKEAEKLVSIGDPLVVQYGFEELINNRVVGRALDDRAGAFAVLETARLLAKKKTQCEVHAVATVQEEIGLRGARTAAFGIAPDVGIAVDVTFATDHPNLGSTVNQEGKVEIGGGPVVTRGPNINPKLFELIIKTAKEEKIPVQIVAEARGTGTDANAIQLNRAGVATALISIPLRYMHSPCELLSLDDLAAVSKLIAAVIERITPKTNFIPF
ncbi:MAG: M42 family metallopeptidase [Kiritimatiellales bacterium]